MEYGDYITELIDYAWIDTEIEEKRGDELELDKQLIALESDINDDEGVIAEHMIINGEKTKELKYGLICIDSKYYFFNVDNNAMELKKIVDDNKFICPYCKSDLCIVSSYDRIINNKKIKVDAFLRHYAGDENSKGCIFHNSKDAEHNKLKLYATEGIKHKQLKMRLIKEAYKLQFLIPEKYKINIDKENYSCSAEFIEYSKKRVVKTDSEKKVLKKDKITNGYVPDIILYTQDGDEIYVEVTVSSGKMVSDYYDIWYRLKKTVLECKLKDGDIQFKYLYDPIRDQARRAILMQSKALADKKKSEVRMLINKTINKIEIKLEKEYGMKKQYIDGKMKLVTSRGEPCKYKWKHILYLGVVHNYNQPDVIWKRLRELGFNVIDGYYEVNKH